MRKIYWFFVITIIMLSTALPVYALSDKEAENMEMYLKILNEAGIMTDAEVANFNGTTPVTREQFSEYVAKMLKINPYVESQYFNDVGKDNEKVGYINALTDMGIVSFNEQRIFEPKREIRYSESCKMLLCAMGYGDYAKLTGKPMNSWVNVATEAEIAIEPKNPDSLTYEEAVVMIFKAMSEPVMVRDGNGNIVKKDVNLFAQYHNIFEGEGVVLATKCGYLEGYSLRDKENVIIGGEEYVSEIDLVDYLGINVIYYYKESNEESCVIYAKPLHNEDFVEINAQDLKNFDNATLNLYYYTDEQASKTKSEKIARNFQIVYNGAPWAGSLNSAISKFTDGTRRGKILLSDADSNGSFETVIVKSYEILPYATIDTGNKSVYGRTEQKIIKYDEFKTARFIQFGEEIKPIDATEAVLAVLESDSKEVVEFVQLTESVEFEIKTVYKDERKIVAADDKIYKVDKSVMEQYGDVLLTYKTVKVYLDSFGYIVRVEKSGTDGYSVGYLINGRGFEEDNGGYIIRLNIYTQNQTIEKYILSDKIRIDEIGYNSEKNPKEVLNAFPLVKNVGGKDIISSQVIRYKLSEDGKITIVDTTNLTDKEDKNSSLVLRHDKQSMFKFGRVGLDSYYSAAETAVFQIPDMNVEGKIYKNGAYADPVASDFNTTASMANDTSYIVSTYNYSDDTFYTDVMVVTQKSVNRVGSALVYLGTTKMYDEEAGVLTVVKCLENGAETEYILEEGLENSINSQGMKYGDMFYISLDTTGKFAIEIKKIFDSETLKFVHDSTNDYWYYGSYNPYSSWAYRDGENSRNQLSRMWVLKKRQDAVFGTYEYDNLKDGVYNEVIQLGNAPVIIIDTESKTFEKTTRYSILSYEEAGENATFMLLEGRLHGATSVIIYK